jgi:hypothetical protein
MCSRLGSWKHKNPLWRTCHQLQYSERCHQAEKPRITYITHYWHRQEFREIHVDTKGKYWKDLKDDSIQYRRNLNCLECSLILEVSSRTTNLRDVANSFLFSFGNGILPHEDIVYTCQVAEGFQSEMTLSSVLREI